MPDGYGVVREYSNGKPSTTLDENYSLSDISDSPYLALDTGSSASAGYSLPITSKLAEVAKSATDVATNFFAPFRNPSIYRLMSWFYSSSNTKSITELNSLVKDVILAPDFKTEHFINFSTTKEQACMDVYKEASGAKENPSPFEFDDSWIKGKVKIPLPCDGFSFESEDQAPKFVVEVYHQKLIEVIQSALSYPSAEKFHTFLFKVFWKIVSDKQEERIYSELFTGEPATEAVLRHLRRELVQAIWMLLMDDDFMHAYIHGLNFRSMDKILRLFFPLFMCRLSREISCSTVPLGLVFGSLVSQPEKDRDWTRPRLIRTANSQDRKRPKTAVRSSVLHNLGI